MSVDSAYDIHGFMYLWKATGESLKIVIFIFEEKATQIISPFLSKQKESLIFPLFFFGTPQFVSFSPIWYLHKGGTY
jgi:hypothetical protein